MFLVVLRVRIFNLQSTHPTVEPNTPASLSLIVAQGRGRRLFGRLEQEDQRLKKQYDCWMDIVRSLELESFILTKLKKPSVPDNLVGPQVSLPLLWVPASWGYFFCA